MRRYILLGVIWAFICITAFLPAHWAAALLPSSLKANIIPQSVSGTLWNGQAKAFLPQTSWPLQINYKVKAVSAILGRPYADTRLSGYGLNAAGKLGLWGSTKIKASAFKIDLNLAQLPISDPRLSGLSGQAFITLENINIKTGCQAAKGQIRTDVLTRNQQIWQWKGPILSGPISCDGDALLGVLSGSDKDYDIVMDIRISLDGLYAIDVTVTPKTSSPTDLGLILALLGFEDNPDGGAQLKEKGRIFQGQRNQ